MLVLSRQRDETIMIGDDIEVRLGINAPSSVPVHRKEVYQAIQRENREATGIQAEDLDRANRRLKKPGVGRASPDDPAKN